MSFSVWNVSLVKGNQLDEMVILKRKVFVEFITKKIIEIK